LRRMESLSAEFGTTFVRHEGALVLEGS
jgi:hypothetical protein